jgi:hypothetical protein
MPVVDIEGIKLNAGRIAYRCNVDGPNAATMAAAVDLLAALRLMLAQMTFQPALISGDLREAIDAARAAVAKAEGGTP